MTVSTLHELLDYLYKNRKKLEDKYQMKKMPRSTYYRKRQGLDLTIKTVLELIEEKA